MKTIVCICVCVSLGLFLPEMAWAGGKHKGGGGGKAAGGGGGGKAAHAGRAAKAAHIGGGGKAGAHLGKGAGQAGHAQHGLNAHQGGRHGLNAHAGSLKGNHIGKLSGSNRSLNNRFIARNHLGGHWRSGLRWRNHHALYAGYHRAWHDHWWWRTHYNSVVFVGGAYWGGYWYWDGGYWFPAWGYNPVFVGYVYDGPIFAYANLPPDQVVVNVQEALQDQGYYTGDVDGQIGTRTRDALAAYQRDNNLEVTAAIDEPTVQSLGLANAEA